ncbi:hypothetical protein JCM37173_21910, partial [Allocoprococcus similis]
ELIRHEQEVADRFGTWSNGA